MSDARLAPPHSLEAEESVIGGVLVHSKRFVDVSPIVNADDFYHPALRAIYEAMLDLDESSIPVDALTVLQRMRELDTFEKLRAFNGAEYLHDLMAKVVTVENIGYHARIVATKAERRRWLEAFQGLVASGYGGGDDAAWFEEAEQAIVGLTARTGRGAEIVPVKKALREFADELAMRADRRKKGASNLVGVSTGYDRVDGILSGLRKGALYVLAARPKMGKSALAMNIIARSAKLGTAWLVFSLEMAQLELSQRLVSAEARIDGQRLSQGEVDGVAQWQRVLGAVERLAGLPIWMSDQATVSIASIRSAARRWRAGEAAKYENIGIVIDYLQLAEASQKKRQSNREQDVSEISRGAKLLARDLGCPVIALSQLNRSLESRTDKRPMLSDLRESGAIEQDADAVCFVYRDSVYHDAESCTTSSCERCAKKDVAEFIVGAQRQGPTGTVELLWQGGFTSFEPLAERGE